MQNFLITLCRLWNVEIITQRLHIVSCCIVTKIILIDVLQYWGRGLGPSPEKKLNILHEIVHFGILRFNGVWGGAHSAVPRQSQGVRGEAESFEAILNT